MHQAGQESSKAHMPSPVQQRQFELRFPSLFRDGYALVFPCDADGRVDVDALSEPAKANYLFARAMIGREFAWPVVRRH
ncbi:hypothetical protein [Azohydromonas lata]|uniref:hypothetical protein n=1 Tax=Azohydromonas lata TaxID=45677 RepID=UPI001EE48191|nr:hypothetical protein [Azohydromonas lata]